MTLGCGSAACATLVAAARLGLTGREARDRASRRRIDDRWREGDDHVLMTGPVEFEREIELDPAHVRAGRREMSAGPRP